jgi:hypothetical protein
MMLATMADTNGNFELQEHTEGATFIYGPDRTEQT